MTGNRSAVRRNPSESAAARIAGRSVLANRPDITAPPCADNCDRSAGTNVSLIDRADVQRSRFSADPALSLVPDAARPAERLLPHHRAGRLVVDVEVAGRETQPVLRPARTACTVVGDHRTGQRIRRARVDDVEDLVVARSSG